MSETFAYTGRELEAMAAAVNYHRWILDIFKPYLGDHVIEVGAGLGSFSELLLSRHDCQTLRLVEPSASMYAQLRIRARELKGSAAVEAFHGTFPSVAPLIAAPAPDSVLYINVLEHVEDDEAELNSVRQFLADQGRILIFVPALPRLFGSMDELVGHFRRYTKSDLKEKLRRAGFKIARLGYFDLPGIFPWWIKYRLLKSETMEPSAVRFYDRFVVPPLRRLETVVRPPIGKNLIAVGEKQSF